jgi:hypothetical protein
VDANGNEGGALPAAFPKLKGVATAESAGGLILKAAGGETDPDAPKLKIPVAAPVTGAGVLRKAAIEPAPEDAKEKAGKAADAAGADSGTFDVLPKAKTPPPELAVPAGSASGMFGIDGVAPKQGEGVAPHAVAPKLKANVCAGAAARAAGVNVSDAVGAALPKEKGALGCASGGDCCESGVLPKIRGANDGADAADAAAVTPAADPPEKRSLYAPLPASSRQGAGSVTSFVLPNVGSAAGLTAPKVKAGAAAGLSAASAAACAPPKLNRPL